MDRLSALPDDLIIHIISFLPPAMLTKTRLLAKSWRFRWSRVPGFGLGLEKQQQITSQNYSNTRCFHIGSATSNHELKSWIATAFARNIRYLVIDLNYRLTLALPPCHLLYLCILDCPADIPVTVHFAALKKLQLVNVRRVCDFSLTHLLKRCPVLEELTIERLNGETCFLISKAQTVTTFEIEIENSGIVFLAIPSLRYLRLRVRPTERKTIGILVCEPLALLIEADIDLMAASKYSSCEVTNFVAKLYNVKCLTLSTPQLMDVPTFYFDKLGGVKFHNLTQLNLRGDWRFITCFLKNANNLRVLTILHTVDHNTKHWMEPKQMPACFASHLEIVNLIHSGWSTKREVNMLEYILKNAKVLKRMKIICARHCHSDWNVKLKAVRKYVKIASTTCELILTLDAAEI